MESNNKDNKNLSQTIDSNSTDVVMEDTLEYVNMFHKLSNKESNDSMDYRDLNESTHEDSAKLTHYTSFILLLQIEK